MAWVRNAAARAAGEAQRQVPRPAPDLPPHPIAKGARFAVRDRAFADLAQLLDAADGVARAVAEALEGGPVRIWPHHFDLATLAVVEAHAGDAVATIGVGLAPPDAIATSGYWYVSPWTQCKIAGASWQRLAVGRWVERGELRMGALPLDALAAGVDRRADLARFLSDAVGTCLAALGRPDRS